MTSNAYRHGDVLIYPAGNSPDVGRELPREPDGVCLAEGEATGHRHFLRGNARLFELAGDPSVKVCKVGAGGATLRHEEHGPITLPEGDYVVSIKRQWSPDGWESVQD